MNQQIIWTPGVSLESLIQQVVESALQFYKGNKTATAQSLGIAIRTLDNRLEKYAKEKAEHEKRVKDAESKRQQFLERQRATPGAAQFDNGSIPSQFDPRFSNGTPVATGVQPESIANASEKHGLPLPKRQKV